MSDKHPENGVEVPFPPGDEEEAYRETPISIKKSAKEAKRTDQDIYFEDHFSLRKSSSHVRFRNRQIRVFDLVNDQLQLEHRAVDSGEDAPPEHHFTMKRMRGGSLGMRVLRAIYTLVAFLMLGMLAVFSSQVLIFQILEIPQHIGTNTTNQLNVEILIATLLSLPLLLYSMGSLMVMASAFVTDQWNGHILFANMTGWSKFQVEWICVVFYLLVPAVTAIATLFAGKQNFWEITSLVWYSSMCITFVVFCALVFHHEMKTSLDMLQLQFPEASMVELAKKGLILTSSQRFAGVREQKYLFRSLEDPDNLPYMEPVSTVIGPYTRLTLLAFNPVFERLDLPVRRYTVEEIRDISPVVTKQTWSLEKQFCKRRYARSIAAVAGDDALEKYHFQSTLACTLLGLVAIMLILVGFLDWMGQGVVILVVAAFAISVCLGIPIALSQVLLNFITPRSRQGWKEDDGEVLYQIWTSFTVSKPKEWYCWLRFIVNLIFLFLWPVISMYVAELPKIATMFLVSGIFSGFRIYLDASLVMAELGSMNTTGSLPNAAGNSNGEAEDKQKKMQALRARAVGSEVMGKVTTSKTISFWILLFAVLGLLYTFQAITTENADGAIPQGGRPPIRLLDDFYYPPQEDLSYPYCKLSKGFDFSPQGFSYIYDYNMLAALAYETPNVTDYILDRWFGVEDVVLDETPFVTKWREDTDNVGSPVSFKLFSVPSLPGTGIVSIRGTQTAEDRLLNAQLYMSSIFTQLVRFAQPFSWLWREIWDDLIASVTWVSSDKLKKADYYRVTTRFVNDLLQNNYTIDGKSFNNLRTTGVSLGGGIALITGAQTGAYTLAIAGVNPTLGRLTFDPPITKEALKTRIMNVVPDRDYISHIGDPPRLTQRIECRTPVSAIGTCHSFWRIFCEFLYTCGSKPRPVLCVCAEQYGYPEPVQNGTRTFAEACAEEEAIVTLLG